MHIKYDFLPNSRLCDSRNLNLSPFCTLTTSSLVKWQPTINKTYEDINTNYTSGLPGPMRPRYPQSMADEELFSSLTKVNDFNQHSRYLYNFILFYTQLRLKPLKGNPKYNAYEKDIAVVNIYFGDSTVFGIVHNMAFLLNAHSLKILFLSRVRESPQDDLVGLHLRLWRDLWTLPWNQLCLRH